MEPFGSQKLYSQQKIFGERLSLICIKDLNTFSTFSFFTAIFQYGNRPNKE